MGSIPLWHTFQINISLDFCFIMAYLTDFINTNLYNSMNNYLNAVPTNVKENSCHTRKKINANTCADAREFVTISYKYHHIDLHWGHDTWWMTYIECNLHLFVPLYTVNIYFSREISPCPPDLAIIDAVCTYMVSQKLHQKLHLLNYIVIVPI